MYNSYAPTPQIADRTPAAMALDNLIRRKLRVGDPMDAKEVVKALQSFYQEESQAMQREAEGLPFFRVAAIPVQREAAPVMRAEVKQAEEDVERDLAHLTTHTLLKDVQAELTGWAYTLRGAVSEGMLTARFALDPRSRDRAMAARRLLGGYARLSRFVGALTPTLSPPYRALAKSLDEVAGVILVLMGDALAEIGYSGGRFLLQAPASELQARRDAVIYALRNLVGTAQGAYEGNEWPRGQVAYRQFLNRLETAGQSDLRALFQENYVARSFDELIHWTTSNNPDDLRALGATASPMLEKFQRLILLGNRLVDPESPPLAAYLSTIQLFLDAFTNAPSGYRLLYIARPPIVFYGLYGVGGPDTATERLLQLVINRGRLAEEADCYLGCDCSIDRVRCQVMLDKILYDVDRAIDLYTLGIDPEGDGEPEHRAAAYAVVIDQFLSPELDGPGVVGPSVKYDTYNNPKCVIRHCVETKSPLDEVLRALRGLLWYPAPSAPSLPTDPDEDPKTTFALSELTLMHQELCIQRETELQWENLLHTMAPSCVHGAGGVLGPTQNLLNEAIDAIVTAITSTGEPEPSCPIFEVDIPEDPATTLAGLVYCRDSQGGTTLPECKPIITQANDRDTP